MRVGVRKKMVLGVGKVDVYISGGWIDITRIGQR